MTSQTSTRAADAVEPEYDVIVSSGGPAAALSGIGTILACELASIKLRRLGGVSGGAVPTALKSCGLRGGELVRLSLRSDFGDNLNPESGLLKIFSRLRGKNHGRDAGATADSARPLPTLGCLCRAGECVSRPKTGLFGSESLGQYIDRCVAERHGGDWPEKFWTMATTRAGDQVVFDADGVTMFRVDGEKVRIADEPPSLGSAIRASCTIPGILAATEYKGLLLFDGALSRDGICPVGVQIRHFDADPARIIACRVNEDALTPISGKLHRLARQIWRVHPDFSWSEETAGVIEFRPLIDHVHTLKFRLSADAKWLAIMVAFESCLAQLALRGILKGEPAGKARSIFDSLGFWRDAHPSPLGARQVLSERFERCLTEHGLY